MELTLDEALKRGVKAHQAGEIQEADKFYTAILNADPRHADANHNMGVLGVGVGKLEGALAFFKTAIEANPNVEQFWISYINTLLNLNQVDEARTALNQARGYSFKGSEFDQFEEIISKQQRKEPTSVNQDPPQQQLQSLIALFNQGELQQVTDRVDQLLERHPNSVVLYNLQGAGLTGLGDLGGGINSFRQAIKIKPDYADAYYNMGNCLKEKGDLDGAMDSYRQAIKIKPDYADAYSNMGVVLQEKGDLDGAMDSYRQAIKIKPDHADAYSNMGLASSDKGDLDGAMESYRQAVKIKPDYADAYYNMGNCLKEKGDLDGAVESYRQAIKIKPDHADAYSNMGLALSDKGDLDGAMESYRQAIKIKPDYADAYSNMGHCLKEKGDLDGAVESCRQAVKIKPDYADAYYNMGNCLKEKGDLDGAMDSYRQAVKIKPDYADAYYNMGNCLKEKGDLDGAMESYRQAVKIKPDYADAFSNMGVVLQEKGDVDGAIESYRQAIKIKPDYRMAWNNLFYSMKPTNSQHKALEDQLPFLREETLSKSARIEASILKYRLANGGPRSENSMREVVNLLSTIHNISVENPDKKYEKVESKPNLSENVVALLHFGRSGTGLLHSLIDNHSQVSTLPSIYLSEFFDVSTWDKISAGGWNALADRFISMYPVLFNAKASNPVPTIGLKSITNMGQKEGLTNLGKGKDEALTVDKVQFREELRLLMSRFDRLDASRFFKLVHMAYEKAVGNSKEKKTLVFYHIHNPDSCAKLNFIRAAPQARWLMMVREPIQSCESWVRALFNNRDYESAANRIVTMLFQVDDVIFRGQESIGIRLEDLKESPDKTITAICDWMGIDKEESLYEMTAQGKKWWGDPSSPDYGTEAMTPFGDASIKRKVGSVFSESDQFILRTLFYPFSVRFGYVDENAEQFKVDLQEIRPMLDEMFDFERVIAKETQADEKQFVKSGSYRYLRTCLIERWNTLDEFETYPHMLEPLPIGIPINHD